MPFTHATHLQQLFTAAYRVNDGSRAGDNSIHVSDLINFCPRAYWLCQKNDRSYHQHSHPGLQLGYTFDMGHAIQQIHIKRLMTQNVLFGAWQCRHCKRLEVGFQEAKRSCPKCKCRAWKYRDLTLELQIPIATGNVIVVRGNIDYIVALSPLFGYITDAKSIKAEDYDKLTDVHIDYKKQLRSYMWLANHPNARFLGEPRDAKANKRFKIDPKKAVCCYSVKGARREPFKPFIVTQDAVFVKRLNEKLQLLAKAFETNTVPARLCSSQAALMAKACAARTLCFPSKGV